MILGEARECTLKSRVSLRSASPLRSGVVKGDDVAKITAKDQLEADFGPPPLTS